MFKGMKIKSTSEMLTLYGWFWNTGRLSFTSLIMT